MKLFFAYWKQRRGVILVLVLCAAVRFGVLALYRLPLAAVAYGELLCAAIGVVALLLDFRKTAGRHKKLEAIQRAGDADADALPEAEGIVEADYGRIVGLLCREQTLQVQRMERKYQDMMDYYTVWAHQIKTPISAMSLTLQKEDSALARSLSAELTRIGQYVEMVLTYLRLDSDSTDYVFRTCDLDSLVRQAVRKFGGEFISRKLKLCYTPLEMQVVTDEKWLSFVVEQALSNALKYTPAGSVSIYREEPQTLCIRDTGIGIAAEDLPRIFEKGFTGGNGRTDRRASGIGLYLCRRICRNLGHTITAESAPDRGTTIRICLAQSRLEVE